ncbi:MAG: response regulator [Desulfobacteraceae bacterium]|nr:response regulator [Desulfobacteraceae bacterium]
MKKMLVVDNHPMLLKVMSNLLDKQGHQVLTALDGLAALEILKTYTPDVIFIDLVMPNISGEKLCRIIRSMPKLKNVFLVILSAIAAEEGASCADYNAHACIAKGPLNKMGEHVLSVLDHLDRGRGDDLQGKIIGKEDIYEREITKELLTSKRHYETTLNHMSEGLLELTLESKIVYANPAALAIIGIPEEMLLSSDFAKLFNTIQYNKIKNLLEEAGDTQRTIALDSPAELNNKLVSLKVIPVKDDDHSHILVILSDISRRKQLEAQLQRAHKMEAVGTLAGGVAHDLNNILSGIVSYPDLILMQIPENSPLRKPIVTMQESGKKAGVIVQDLLTLARRGVATMEVVNINDIITAYLQSPEHQKLQSYHPRVAVETNLEAELLNISGSSVHLTKTFMNLVSNAAEAMINGGKIFISTENCYIDRPISGYDCVEEGDYITLRVSDAGIGISSKDIDRIFEPFYTKKIMGRSGTGLGMAVVWGTVKDHNGYIDVQSIKGKGTTFTLYFPVSRQEIAKEKTLLPMEDYMGKEESILVVDDVKEQREIAFAMLTTLGYTVDTAASGEEAVVYLKEHAVDLIVLDMIMDPGIDGLDTYKQILEIHPGQKAIIASGFSETERVKEAQRLGAGSYVKKPYTLEKIGLAVRDE